MGASVGNKPGRENELSQTNQEVGGVCVGVVPRVQSKPSRSLYAHRGKKLLQDLQDMEYTVMKKAMRPVRRRSPDFFSFGDGEGRTYSPF